MLKHSFPPVVTPDTRVLILGSLPGERSLAERRYYAHPQNGFWRLMSAVLEQDLVALEYDARLAALQAHGAGLWDVVRSATRAGSSDAAIRDLAPNDLAALVRRLPQLAAIAFNGATAHREGLRALGVEASRVDILPLPSSSPLHTIGDAAKLPAWLALRRYLAPA